MISIHSLGADYFFFIVSLTRADYARSVDPRMPVLYIVL